MLIGKVAGLNFPLPPLQYTGRIVVPSARVKTLNSAPFILLNGQPGQAIFPEYSIIHKPAGIAYVAPGNIQITWTGSGSTALASTNANFLDQTAKRTIIFNNASLNGYNIDTAVMVGTNLVLNSSGADPTTGDSDLIVQVLFRVWDSAPLGFS